MAVKKAGAARKPGTAAKSAPAKAGPTTAAAAAPVKPTPVKSSPVKSSPVKSSPVKASSAKTTPTKTNPVKATPAQAQPVAEAASAAAAMAEAAKPAPKVAKAQGSQNKKSFPDYAAVATVNQENIEAVVKAGSVMARGIEAFGRELMTFAQASAEANAAMASRLAEVKSLKEALDLQSAHARESFDKAFAETGKLTEISVRLANEAFEPLQARVNTAVEKLWKAPAA